MPEEFSALGYSCSKDVVSGYVSAYSNNIHFGAASSSYEIKQDQKVIELQQKLSAIETKLRETQEKTKDYADIVREFEREKAFGHVLKSVNEQAKQALTLLPEVRGWFEDKVTHKAFVMSVDIRRSTELMLRAVDAAHFSTFITDLCVLLMEAVKCEFGVIEKFTGDGILCFFPYEFSGKENAAVRVLQAAERCTKSLLAIIRSH